MKLPYAEFDLSGLQSYPLASRPSKVRVADFARPAADAVTDEQYEDWRIETMGLRSGLA